MAQKLNRLFFCPVENVKLHQPAAYGHQLTSLVSSSHVIQHRSIVDEGVQFTEKDGKTEQRLRVNVMSTCAVVLSVFRWVHVR